MGGDVRVLIVAVGAGLGGMSRYILQGWILERTGPSIIALFVINVTGAFALGLVTTLAVDRSLINPEVRLLLTTGFLGGYTTFSSWMLESFQLVQVGDFVRAAVNVVGSAIVGLIAVYLGILAGRFV
jgi:CrcB protein